MLSTKANRDGEAGLCPAEPERGKEWKPSQGFHIIGLFLWASVACAQANAKGTTMALELKATVAPALLPEREMKDIVIELVLKNSSTRPVTIYPSFTALSWLSSVASMGMSWDLAFVSAAAGASASGRELRTYYGPPGEPATGEALRKAGVVLKPGKEHKTTLKALWVPNALLDPSSLSLEVLDPQGFDNLKSIPDLKRSSVLVFDASPKDFRAGLGKDKEILRDHMVVFFSAPGKYGLQASYRQYPTMSPVVDEVSAVAAPVELTIAGAAVEPARAP
jgi:hypothetical protein